LPSYHALKLAYKEVVGTASSSPNLKSYSNPGVLTASDKINSIPLSEYVSDSSPVFEPPLRFRLDDRYHGIGGTVLDELLVVDELELLELDVVEELLELDEDDDVVDELLEEDEEELVVLDEVHEVDEDVVEEVEVE
jgi:hypothetical protein